VASGELLVVILVGAATALATGVGAVPVFLLGAHAERLRPLLGAVAAVVMSLASVTLVRPALDEGSALIVASGVTVGAGLLLVSRRRLSRRGRYAGADQVDARRSLLVFGVLFVHSFPEGLAVGAAWGAQTAAIDQSWQQRSPCRTSRKGRRWQSPWPPRATRANGGSGRRWRRACRSP
jgi:zinc transporter ZupT